MTFFVKSFTLRSYFSVLTKIESQITLPTTFFITAVDVSARLGVVLKEAKSISLQAMNAKALVARAGENVRTFKPITDYMVELSSDTIRLVEDINEEALKTARVSLDLLRWRKTVEHMESAQGNSAQALYRDSLSPALEQSRGNLTAYNKELFLNVRKLNELLEEIETRMLAANVVTSTSRLEAATVSSVYRSNFASIVAKFEAAAINIRTTVQDCRKVLNKRS